MKRLTIFLIVLVSVAMVALTGFGAYWLWSRDTLRTELESVLSATFETPVTVGELKIGFYPKTHLIARRLAFANPQDPSLSVGAVQVDVSLRQIWQGDLVISELRFEDFRCGLGALSAYARKLGEPSGEGAAVDVELRHILASPVNLTLAGGGVLGPYQVEAEFSEDGAFEALEVSRLDRPISLRMTRGEPARVALALEAKHWQPEVGPALRFDRIEATGHWSGGREFQFTKVRASAYDGSLTGSVHVSWQTGWEIKGQAKIKRVDTEALLSALKHPILKSRMDWSGSFELRAEKPSELLRNGKLDGDIVLKRGVLYPKDSARKKHGRKPVRFEDFRGHLKVTGRHIHMQGLRVSAASYFPRRLGPYALAADLKRGGGLAKLVLRREDGRMELNLRRAGKGYAVRLTGKDWVPPVRHRLLLNQVKLVGRARDQALIIDGVKAKLYGGRVEATGAVSWKKGWAVDLKGKVARIDTEQFLAVFDKRTLAGRFYATGRVRMWARRASELFDKPRLNGDFLVRNGAVYKVDLKKAATSFSKEYVTGGKTEFEELGGRLAMAKGAAKVTNVNIISSGLQATGYVDVNARRELDGEVDVGLKSIAAIVGVPVKIHGTTDEPRLRPTTVAIAGAAAGTAVLGPGVGTAIGLKAGQALKRLGGFLNRIGGDEQAQ